jgi:hypothetical protein
MIELSSFLLSACAADRAPMQPLLMMALGGGWRDIRSASQHAALRANVAFQASLYSWLPVA